MRNNEKLIRKRDQNKTTEKYIQSFTKPLLNSKYLLKTQITLTQQNVCYFSELKKHFYKNWNEFYSFTLFYFTILKHNHQISLLIEINTEFYIQVTIYFTSIWHNLLFVYFPQFKWLYSQKKTTSTHCNKE